MKRIIAAYLLSFSVGPHNDDDTSGPYDSDGGEDQ